MEAPGWFTAALGQAGEDCAVEVDGAEIRYLDWGASDRPGVVLVHGGAAHRRWWSFLAPLLAPAYHVVALDLSGHGDSGRREVYAVETWADEVLAVAAHAGMSAPVVVGHSMGGVVTVVAASRRGQELAGAVVIDAPVRRPDPESEQSTRSHVFKAPGVYATLEEAMRHFSLVPRQPLEHAYIRDHVARTSLHQTPAGWTWKFDPGIFARPPRGFSADLASTRCRVAVLYGELSVLVTPDVQDYMSELLGRTAPFVEIPQAHHHLLLDQPLAFLAALRAILADWEHTVPRQRRLSGR